MPRKVFTAGEVLAAADVNSFLMDQTVMTFAGTAARGSAIGTATEGMVTWLNDENALQVYDGTQWNGLAASGGNAIINGAFEINQRGLTSSTANNAYGFDRWQTTQSGGTVTTSSQAFTLGSAPVAGFEAANFVRVVTAGHSGSGDYAALFQPIESVRSFANQTVTISFYAKANSGTPKIGIELNQNFGTGGSPSSAVSVPLSAVTISTAWTRYTATVAVPSISGKTIGTANDSKLNLFLWVSAGSTFASRASSIGVQNNTFDIWGVQLEAGPTANVFRRNATSLQGELAACQRYYWRSNSPGSFGIPAISGHATSTTAAIIFAQLPVSMRVAPSSIEWLSLQVIDFSSVALGITTQTLNTARTTTDLLSTDIITTGATGGRGCYLRANNTTAGYLAASAEL
jgi:hypothetical protein